MAGFRYFIKDGEFVNDATGEDVVKYDGKLSLTASVVYSEDTNKVVLGMQIPQNDVSVISYDNANQCLKYEYEDAIYYSYLNNISRLAYYDTTSADEESKKMSTTKKVLIGCGIAIAVAGIAFGIYKFIKR